MVPAPEYNAAAIAPRPGWQWQSDFQAWSYSPRGRFATYVWWMADVYNEEQQGRWYSSAGRLLGTDIDVVMALVELTYD